MNLLFFTRHEWLGASSRYRSIQYFPFLEKAGYKVMHRPLFPDRYLESKANGDRAFHIVALSFARRLRSILRDTRRADLIFVEKELFPYLPAWSEAALWSSGKPLIYDYDDAIWHSYDRFSKVVWGRPLSEKIARVVAKADHVIAGSHYIAAQCAAWGAPSVSLIPTTVSAARYQGQGLDARKTTDVVWIGSTSTGRHLATLIPVLQRLHQILGINVRLIGYSSSDQHDLPSFISVEPWSAETELELIAGARVGIMPVPDEPFERGKCGFKLIQYMGIGLPVVASPVGENNQIVQPGINGFLASTDDEWIASLQRLLTEPELARSFGSNGYKRYKDHYSTEEAVLSLIGVIERFARRTTSL